MDKFEQEVRNKISKDAANENTPVSSISDGYHSFRELYDFRKAYNALLFNAWYKLGKFDVYKSKSHEEGGDPMFEGYFVVGCATPFGQVTNHYKLEDWNLFQIEEREFADKWDGHTPKVALQRLMDTATDIGL